ncbi:phage tail assembly protein [Chromobacterium vaccinii]|uniref:phage tail assembly protein n=1 Tax=Chromobacterium vaccinii TaxID=1108595 RepID=UPI003C76ECB8
MSIKTIPLKHGLKVGQHTYKSITLRAPKLGDLIDAEQDPPASNLFAFRAALIAQVASQVAHIAECRGRQPHPVGAAAGPYPAEAAEGL